MVYQLKSSTVLIKINRANILDINLGDELVVSDLTTETYKWKDQDSQFMESNPDAEVFLKLKKQKEGPYLPVKLVVKEGPSE